jgi:hypothetical protein
MVKQRLTGSRPAGIPGIYHCSTERVLVRKEEMETGRTGQAGRWVFVATGLALLAGAGCGGVNRRFVVETNVPNAQVYIDNRPVGAAPAHAPFEYYGYHNIEIVHPDYQRESRRVHIVAPWYAYPPMDFLVEVFWPFRIEDVRRQYFELRPLVRTDPAELINQAEELRQRGMNLPAPEHPAPPKPDPGALPSPVPLPQPTPALPAEVPGITP